jgi:hypothetical protein
MHSSDAAIDRLRAANPVPEEQMAPPLPQLPGTWHLRPPRPATLAVAGVAALAAVVLAAAPHTASRSTSEPARPCPSTRGC